MMLIILLNHWTYLLMIVLTHEIQGELVCGEKELHKIQFKKYRKAGLWILRNLIVVVSPKKYMLV